MKRSIVNFLKADLRMPQLMFWDWLFPLLLVLIFSFFIRGSELSEFIFPGLISLMILQSIIFSIPYRLAQFKELGVFKLIKQKGSIGKFLISFYISRILILFIQIFLIILLGSVILQVELSIDWFMLIYALFFSITIFIIIGSICGLIVKSQNSALGISQAIYFLLIGTSGIFYPLDKSPVWLESISTMLPLTYINKLWKETFFGTQGNLSFEILILIGSLIILLILMAILLRIGKGREVNETSTSIR